MRLPRRQFLHLAGSVAAFPLASRRARAAALRPRFDGGHLDWVHSTAFDPTGAFIVSASRDGTMRTWDVKTGACVRVSTQLPRTQWASADVAAKRFIAASTGAWRSIGYVDENGHEIEAEALGPIAGMEWPVDMREPA